MGRIESDETLILCVGPQGMPRTGQALATDTWIAHSRHKVVSVNNNFEGLSGHARFVRTLALPLKVFLETRRTKPAAMYLSIKRSVFGAIGDLACVLVYRSIVTGPVVVHLHGADLATARDCLPAKALFRLLWSTVTDVIILSPQMDEQLRGLPKRRVHIVRNFSLTFASSNAISKKIHTIRQGPLRVLYLSNIMFSKGFSYLISAVNQLRADGQSVTLTLVGKPMRDREMSAKDALNLLEANLNQEGIRYLGVVHGSKLRRLLETAHIVALPTFYPTEAQPISLIEGMAFGCIPLTTRHNYNEDFLDPRIAVFVEPQNAKAISDALYALIADPEDAVSRIQLALNLAIEKHGVERFVRAIDGVLTGAIQNVAHPGCKTGMGKKTDTDGPSDGASNE